MLSISAYNVSMLLGQSLLVLLMVTLAVYGVKKFGGTFGVPDFVTKKISVFRVFFIGLFCVGCYVLYNASTIGVRVDVINYSGNQVFERSEKEIESGDLVPRSDMKLELKNQLKEEHQRIDSKAKELKTGG